MPSYSNQAPESSLIYEGAAISNYGTNAELSIGGASATRRRSLVRFPNLPSGVESVRNSKLYLYSSNETLSTASNLDVYICILSWVESQVTWNVYSTGNSWGTAGCSNTTADFINVSLGTTSISASIAANTEVVVNLNDVLMKAYLDSLSTNAGGFLLKLPEATSYWNPHSNDAVTSGYRPKLTFDYETGGGNIIFF